MPHLEYVHAITLLRRFEISRTKPFVLTCLDEAGAQRDFVVKLHSQLSSGILGEFWCAKLGDILEMPLPTTAIVVVDKLLGTYNTDFAKALALVDGPHFGSELIGPGALTPFDGTYSIPQVHFNVALEIFAFDVLIQNPDRRKTNPNLYFNQGRFWMIDHELALDFEHVLGGMQMPWDIPHKNRLFVEHLFYPKLKGKVDSAHVATFIEKLRRVTVPLIEDIAGVIPKTWSYPTYNTLIVEYLRRVISDLPRLQRGILEVLA